jgi:methyl coenzyme M reductase beta subunit
MDEILSGGTASSSCHIMTSDWTSITHTKGYTADVSIGSSLNLLGYERVLLGLEFDNVGGDPVGFSSLLIQSSIWGTDMCWIINNRPDDVSKKSSLFIRNDFNFFMPCLQPAMSVSPFDPNSAMSLAETMTGVITQIFASYGESVNPQCNDV